MNAITESHQGRLGCSELAAAAGVSPWMTPYQLWEIKTNRASPLDLSGELRIQLGHRLEDIVAALYTEKTGIQLAESQREFVGTIGRAPVVGHIDRRAANQNHGVEIKTSLARFGNNDWGQESTDEIPMHYLVQCLGYLMLSGWDGWEVVVLLAGPELRVYRVLPDQSLFDALSERISTFWQCVVTDIPPPITTDADASRRWPHSVNAECVADMALLAEIAELNSVRSLIKPLTERLQAATVAIKAGMGERERLTDSTGRPLCTWKTTQRQTLDTRALAEAHPEIYRQFLKTTSTRTFRVSP